MARFHSAPADRLTAPECQYPWLWILIEACPQELLEFAGCRGPELLAGEGEPAAPAPGWLALDPE
ncbi:hypothetical protein AB4Y87_20750 [Paenarthrobacter sp. RAF54_2]|uniref:hypothetical protein n=1 Tax=Paenarthrobacter sp. RAF54_2 TaxID=3233061 RepID=UPI003F97CFB9